MKTDEAKIITKSIFCGYGYGNVLRLRNEQQAAQPQTQPQESAGTKRTDLLLDYIGRAYKRKKE
ncbi:hypothetical protein YC2023_120330 [Brassica napus]